MPEEDRQDCLMDWPSALGVRTEGVNQLRGLRPGERRRATAAPEPVTDVARQDPGCPPSFQHRQADPGLLDQPGVLSARSRSWHAGEFRTPRSPPRIGWPDSG